MITDNDSGGKAIFNAVKDVGSVQIDINDPNVLYKCFNNVFLIKTPHLPPRAETCIEQLFDASTLATVVGGKTLNYAKDGDTSTEYGKHIFAEAVIRPNGKPSILTGSNLFWTLLKTPLLLTRDDNRKTVSA
jgi:hypothetical protein